MKKFLSLILAFAVSAFVLPFNITAKTNSATSFMHDFGDGSGDVSAVMVSTPQQLQNINNNLSGNYVLSNDIDMSGFAFTPIGSSSAFTGMFDGQGYSIKNLTIASNDNTGLFGIVDSAFIISVCLYKADVTGCSNAGGIVGSNIYGTIASCYFNGFVGGDEIVGGVCGFNYYGAVVDCLCEGYVQGQSAIGGICGLSSYGDIYYCENDAEITSDGFDGGGICGQNDSSIIVESFNIGTIFGTDNAGGVAGSNYGTISSCYNSGIISAKNGVGGIAGSNYSYCMIENSYNVGAYIGITSDGSLAGVNEGTVKNCYYVISDICPMTATGFSTGDEINCVGLYSSQMTGTYESGRAEECMDLFDFNEVWATHEDDEEEGIYYYPQLICALTSPNSPSDYDLYYWPSTISKDVSAQKNFITECVSTAVSWLCAVSLIYAI